MQELPPSDQNEPTLHDRLVAGDLIASAQIAEAYLSGLVQYLESKLPPWADAHLAGTAATDAMLNYLQRPAQYDPARASLQAYLRMSAYSDLLNLLQQQRRRENAPKAMQVVELDAPGSEHTVEDESMLSVEEQVLICTSPLWQRLLELLPDRRDVEVVLLMMSDVRQTAEYVTVLEIEHLTPQEQTAVVKRTKDRLKKWLQRHISRSELEDHG